MKKSYLFLATLLVVAAVSVAVVSCKKEKQGTASNNTEQAIQSANNMDEYLILFKEKLLSTQKGDETISIEQAQRDLGNLLNFAFGDANYASNMFQRDTIHLSIPTNNGECNLAELSAIYKEAVVKVKDIYSKVNLPEKSVYYITCSFIQESKDENADVELVVTTRGFGQSILITTFDETDNWRLDSLRGKCDGTCIGNDHLTKLMQTYYNTRVSVDCTNGRLYYTDSGQSFFWGIGFPEQNPAGPFYNLGFWLWCGHPWSVHNYCVGYEEMRYYLGNLHSILGSWMLLNGHQVVLTIDLYLSPYSSQYYQDMLSVKCDFEYATYHCTNEPLE